MYSFRRALAIVGLWLATATAVQAAQVFSAHLAGTQEATPNASMAYGVATLALNDAQTALTFDITIFGLDLTGLQTAGTDDNLMSAHVHVAAPGVNGAVVFGFFGSPFNDNNPNDVVVTPFALGVGGTVSGKWDANEGNNTTLITHLPNLLAGLAYLNFHTVQFPGGEIRGQILRVPEPGTLTLIGLGLAGLGLARRPRKA